MILIMTRIPDQFPVSVTRNSPASVLQFRASLVYSWRQFSMRGLEAGPDMWTGRRCSRYRYRSQNTKWIGEGPSCSRAGYSTEMVFILCTWFGELCSCCSLTALPGPAWVLLNWICKELISSLHASLISDLNFEASSIMPQGVVAQMLQKVVLLQSSYLYNRTLV